MGPELLGPQQFGFEDSRPTRRSDCYALGMVVYEVLAGRFPFYQDANFVVFKHVLEGKHPRRPRGVEGAWFTDDVWGLLERCWAWQPDSRPSIRDVLQRLVGVSGSWTLPPPLPVADPPTTDSPTPGSSGSGTEESTNGDDVPPPSQVFVSQPSQKPLPGGYPDENSTLPLLHKALGQQDPSVVEEAAGIRDRVGWQVVSTTSGVDLMLDLGFVCRRSLPSDPT